MNIFDFIGEATEYDKKHAVERNKPKSWLKTVSAFANTVGGVLVFGVADNDEMIGLEDIKSDAEFVSQKVKERISPYPEVILEPLKIGGKYFLLLRVAAGEQVPYFYRADGVTEAYIRIGNETVIADATTLKRLILRGQRGSFDSEISPYRFEDFAFTKVKSRFKAWTGNSMTEKTFESFNIKNAKGQLTFGGAILADDSPVECSRLFCTRWNGLSKSGGIIDALDSARYAGSVISLLEDGMAFVKRNIRKGWKKTETSRIEMPDYCERSVFESLVNALVHRDYLITGSEVHIDIFDDRMVVYSPGGMVDGFPIQDRDINTVPSMRRNEVLADVFDRLGYMEREGSGLSKIREEYESAANYSPELEPVFYSNRSEFTVTLSNLNYQSNVAQETPSFAETGRSVELNGLQRSVLNLLKRNPRMSQIAMSDTLLKSKTTIHRTLLELKEMQIIERIGARKNGYWKVKNLEK